MRRRGVAGGVWVALCALMICAPVAVAQKATFTSDVEIDIADGVCGVSRVQSPATPYGSPIEVALRPRARITDVDVTLKDLAYILPELLRVVVAAPDGTAVMLMDGAGKQVDLDQPPTWTFDDGAATGVPSATPVSGTYRPTAPGVWCPHGSYGPSIPLPAPAPAGQPYADMLDAFNGGDPSGVWRLYIVGTTGVVPRQAVNNLAGWSLDITTVEPPVCEDRGPLSVGHDASLSVALDCADADGDPMTLVIDTSPAHGTLGAIDSATQEVAYTPHAGFSGSDTFTYAATDKDGRSNVARVDLKVAPPPAAPPPAAPRTPPAPPVVPPSPAQASIVTVLALPTATALMSPSSPKVLQTVHRMQFDQMGRFTFIYRNRQTGRRLQLLPGSRIGARTLTRRASAPVLNNATPGRRLVLAARFASGSLPANLDQVELRIVLKRPDGTLVDTTVAADGRLI